MNRRKARRKLLTLSATTFPEYRPSRFHRILCSYLDRVASGEIKRLMIFAPPQHGKSEIVSRRFPSLALGQNPNLRIIAASYAHTLAASINRDVKRIIDSESFAELFPKTQLYGKKSRADADSSYIKTTEEFEVVNSRGGYRSAGVGAGIVGKPAGGLLIDDPVAGAEQAYSPTYRDKLHNWYGTEARTRLAPDGWVVLMHQRWHEDDLAGRLLKLAAENEYADQWCVVRFPARAYPKDSPLRCPDDWREEGEPLWPERYDDAYLTATEASMSPFQWAAVYQQNPQPLEGAHFKAAWFRTWEDHSDVWHLGGGRLVKKQLCRVIAVVDPAASEKQTADHTAAGAFVLTPTGDLLVMEMVRQRLRLEEIAPMVAGLCRRWSVQAVMFESNGFQAKIAMECRRTPGMPPVVETITGPHSKLVRATPAIARAASGQIFLPESAPWSPVFIDECLRFTGLPGGQDDQVDCLSVAAEMQSKRIDSGADKGRPMVIGR